MPNLDTSLLGNEMSRKATQQYREVIRTNKLLVEKIGTLEARVEQLEDQVASLEKPKATTRKKQEEKEYGETESSD